MFRWPKTRRQFWQEKISKNRERDRLVRSYLKDQGWRVLTVWECALRGPGRYPLEHVLERCEDFVRDITHEVEATVGAIER